MVQSGVFNCAPPLFEEADQSGDGSQSQVGSWPDTIVSFSGATIDVREDIWRVGVDQTADISIFRFNDDIYYNICFYITHLLRNYSPDYVENNCKWLSPLSQTAVVKSISKSIDDSGTLDLSVYKAFSSALKGKPGWITSAKAAFIRWYLWSCDMGLHTFDDDVAIELEHITLPRSARGQAVLSEDPQKGPLTPIEVANLLAALRGALLDNLVDRCSTAICWLLVSFGLNSKHIRLLEEDDLKTFQSQDGTKIYILNIPRIKKRKSQERSEFRYRSLDPQLGSLLETVIAENRSAQSLVHDNFMNAGGQIEKFARPLFRQASHRPELTATSFEKWSYRMRKPGPRTHLAYLVKRLDLKAEDGSPLKLYPRRLRYTLATRMVENGASPREVADALDHSSTDHVMVYFNSRFGLVEKVDKALGPYLITHAQAFMGTIVRGPSEAVRGDDPSSEIALVSTTVEGLRKVGTCGEYGFCDLYAPVACYTCRKFQAWVEADHRGMLNSLVNKREDRLSVGSDIKITKIHDRTIAAVKEVIRRCDAMLAGVI